jgi:tetratricopeptide (TPR) repeat protein
MKIFLKKTLIILSAALVLSSCELTKVESPNVTDDVYVTTPYITKSWIVGLRRQLALTLNQVIVNTELVSDNYFNNRTLSSKVFDIPQIPNYDLDVNNIQSAVHRLRELSEFGLSAVVPADKSTLPAEKAEMLFMNAYAHLLSAELFVGLPGSAKGPVLSPSEHYNLALSALEQAIALQTDPNEKLAYTLVKARVYYGLGNATKAKEAALAAMANKLLLKQVFFDGQNSAPNDFQTYIFSSTNNEFAPLPRLDFLDPKYFHTTTIAQDQKPVSFVKSEEAYLILAEAQVSENDLGTAKTTLKNLLSDVVQKRPVFSLDDKKETRNGGNRTDYPLKAVKVKFDANDSPREGYVLDRQAGNIAIATISGTKVTATDIDLAQSQDELLYLVYRLRQEIFFAEGRRMTDLGIRFPVSNTEQLNNPNVRPEHGVAQIPAFIPLNRAMDDFTNDTGSGIVTMKYDMNKVLIANKKAIEIFPFLN